MAWTEKLPSGRYRGGYRVGSQKRYTEETFTHKRAAEREAARLESESRDLGWSDPRAAERTWGDWSTEWLKGVLSEKSTQSSNGYLIAKHVLPRWKDVRLVDIDRHSIRTWVKEMQEYEEKPLAATSAKRVFNVFSSSLTAAVDAGALRANPCLHLRLNIPDNKNERVYTQAEQAALFGALPDELSKALVAVLLGTGCRLGEALALEAQFVHIKQGTIRFRQTWDSHNRVLKPYTKGRLRRTVPVDDWLLDIITTLVALRPSGYLFAPSSTADPIDVPNWRKRVWLPAAASIRLNRAGLEHGSIHTLRHTYATEQLEAGLSLAEIADLLGHSSITTTERYAHRRSAVGDKARGTISDPRVAPAPELPDEPENLGNLIRFPGV